MTGALGSGDGVPRSPDAPDDTVGSASEQGVWRSVWVGVRETLIVVVLAMALSLVVKTFLVQPFHIPSGSMEDTLVKDDRVLVSKLTPGPFALQHGDVVVFTDPDHWLGEIAPVQRGPVRSALIFLGLVPDDSHEHLIKRVIGLPGDHVTCCTVGGQVTVNGVAVTEPYVKAGDSPGGGRAAFDIVVPTDKVWVMGDHRSDSADSRWHDDGTGATGSVPLDDIHGKAIIVVWPIDRWASLALATDVFAAVP